MRRTYTTMMLTFSMRQGCESNEPFKRLRTVITWLGKLHEKILGTISLCIITQWMKLSSRPRSLSNFWPPHNTNGEPKVTTGRRVEELTTFLVNSIKDTKTERLPPRECPANWIFALSPCLCKWSIISGMNCSYIPLAASYIPLWTRTSVSCKRIDMKDFGNFLTKSYIYQHLKLGYASSEERSFLNLRMNLTSNVVGSNERFACQDATEYDPCNHKTNCMAKLLDVLGLSNHLKMNVTLCS